MEDKNSKKKPCKSCPFLKRDNPTKEDLGGASVETYIGQALGPFWLPCHKDKKYQGKQSNPEEVSQCRGAAIFRTNIRVTRLLPEGLLKLPEDPENVYSSPIEFYRRAKGFTGHTLLSTVQAMLQRDYPGTTDPFGQMRDDEIKKLEVFQIEKIKLIK